MKIKLGLMLLMIASFNGASCEEQENMVMVDDASEERDAQLVMSRCAPFLARLQRTRARTQEIAQETTTTTVE